MGMRYLTKRFGAYTIDKCEKKYKKDFMDFIDIGNLSIGKMIILIQMGNGLNKNGEFNLSEEDAANKLDEFLSLDGQDNSIVDAYLQLLDEINRDTKILKGTGVTIESIKNDLYSKMESKATDKVDDKVVEFKPQDEKVENELLPNEVPKVSVDGFVSLDDNTEQF